MPLQNIDSAGCNFPSAGKLWVVGNWLVLEYCHQESGLSNTEDENPTLLESCVTSSSQLDTEDGDEDEDTGSREDRWSYLTIAAGTWTLNSEDDGWICERR